jgi:hypothetical protein
MTGITYCGRLGNQIFQFHFFQYIKATNKGKFIFMPNPRHSTIYKYFDLGKYNYQGSLWYAAMGKLLYKLVKFKEIYIQNTEVPKPLQVADRTFYHGFHQTDFYLKNTPDPVKISIKKQYVDHFEKQYGEIFSKEKTIVVHIRRTDYLKYGKRDISLPIEYFKQRLDAIENKDDYRIIFCSDDMPFVKENFPAKPNYLFSDNDEITDFQVLMNADIAIISNSTFAWWAAYLSPKKNRVIAPKNWMAFHIGKEHPKGVMTSKFEWYGLTNAS